MSRKLTLDIEWLRKNIYGVIQVGIGATGPEMNIWCDANIDNQIYIEPYEPHFNSCVEKVKTNIPKGINVKCYKYALTDVDGVINFYLNIHKNSHSLFEMDENRPKEVKWMRNTEKIQVEGKTLDSLFKENNIDGSKYNLLFMDAQCSEPNIIKGAKNTLHFFDYIEMEVSTKYVYKNSLLYDDIIDIMNHRGYKMLKYDSIYVEDKELGRDVTFVKKEL